MIRHLAIAAMLAGCSGESGGAADPGATPRTSPAQSYGWTTLPAPPPPAPHAPAPAPAPAAPALAGDAGLRPAPPGDAGRPRVRLAWEIGPLRRLGWGRYRNVVELVVHVDPRVRIRIPDLQYCWDMVHDPSADPVPGAVAVLSCYNAGYGDYVVVARERGRAEPGGGAVERYVVKAYGRGEGIEEEAPVEHLRTVGRFRAPRGATFESDLSWPHGTGDSFRDDDS